MLSSSGNTLQIEALSGKFAIEPENFTPEAICEYDVRCIAASMQDLTPTSVGEILRG